MSAVVQLYQGVAMSTPTTCEPSRSSAYSEDIRWRVVWQSEALGYKPSEIASNLNIDASTVRRVIHIFLSTGTVNKRPYQRACRVITEPVKLFIFTLLLQRPGILLREITSEVEKALGLEVSESAVCKLLRREGFTRQKLVNFALQRDDAMREQFKADVSLYSRESLLFIDETGSDCQGTVRSHGYSLKGRPMKVAKFLVRGERVSALAAMSVNGIIALKIVQGSVDGDAFYDFVCTLLPHLLPYDSHNQHSVIILDNCSIHHSVIILDNCSIHHVDEVDQVFKDTSALVHYLPPYSPDYNPIELAFSKVKYTLKAMETEMQELDDRNNCVACFLSNHSV